MNQSPLIKCGELEDCIEISVSPKLTGCWNQNTEMRPWPTFLWCEGIQSCMITSYNSNQWCSEKDFWGLAWDVDRLAGSRGVIAWLWAYLYICTHKLAASFVKKSRPKVADRTTWHVISRCNRFVGVTVCSLRAELDTRATDFIFKSVANVEEKENRQMPFVVVLVCQCTRQINHRKFLVNLGTVCVGR